MGVSLHGCSGKVQPLLLTLDKGYLLTAAPLDLERGVAPLGPPAPVRPLLLGKKAMINLDSVLKSRDITWPAKVHIVKAMVFPVVRYGCESWTIKKAERQRIDAFELRCWRRLLRVPWTKRRSNQSIKSTLNIHWKD